MLTTYQATLRGDHLEWRQDAPPQTLAGEAVRVHVTVLTEAPASTGNGPEMAAALEKIALSGTLAGIDAEAWQREMRADKPLVERDE